MHSTVGIKSHLFQRSLDKALVTDFFGGVSSVELTTRKRVKSKQPRKYLETPKKPKQDVIDSIDYNDLQKVERYLKTPSVELLTVLCMMAGLVLLS